MAVADQAGEHQISNVPSEIHRDPVWVSRRPNHDRTHRSRVRVSVGRSGYGTIKGGGEQRPLAPLTVP
jgi:hypothetical protein